MSVRALDVGVGQDDHDLLAAVARDDVDRRGYAVRMRSAKAAQHLVAGLVAVGVVDAS